MTWADLFKLVAGAVIGFAIREVSLIVERRRKATEEERSREPDWQVDWVFDDTWTLTNIGSATAYDVRIRGEAAPVLEWSRIDMARNDQRAFRVPHRGGDAQVVITWKSHRDQSWQGPVTKYIPPPKS